MAHKVKQLAAQNRTEYLAAISKEKGIILFAVLKSSTYCSGILIIKKLRTGDTGSGHSQTYSPETCS